MKKHKEKILTVRINKNSIIVKNEDWDMYDRTYSKSSSFEYLIIIALKGALKVKEDLKENELLNIKTLLEKDFILEMGKINLETYYVEIKALFKDGTADKQVYFNKGEKENGIDSLLVEADDWATLIVDRTIGASL